MAHHDPRETTMTDVPLAIRNEANIVSGEDTPGDTVETAGPPSELHDDLAHPKPSARPTFLHADIHNYFWVPQSNEGDVDASKKFTAQSHQSTINSSAADPSQLRYIMLFRDANPRWDSDGIIFVKSSLRILPGGEIFRDDPEMAVNKSRGFAKSSKGGRRKKERTRSNGASEADKDGMEDAAATRRSDLRDVIVRKTGAEELSVDEQHVFLKEEDTAADAEDKVRQPEDGLRKEKAAEDPAQDFIVSQHYNVFSPARDEKAYEPKTAAENELTEPSIEQKHEEDVQRLNVEDGATAAVIQRNDMASRDPTSEANTTDKDHDLSRSHGGAALDTDPEPPYSPDLSLYDTGRIAIFEQVSKQKHGPFRFSGYYKIKRLQYLAPWSPELFRMLQQKFSVVDKFGRVQQRHRTSASWEASMRQRWAVLKMEKDEDANSNLPAPNIKAMEKNVKAGAVPERGSQIPQEK